MHGLQNRSEERTLIIAASKVFGLLCVFHMKHNLLETCTLVGSTHRELGKNIKKSYGEKNVIERVKERDELIIIQYDELTGVPSSSQKIISWIFKCQTILGKMLKTIVGLKAFR